MPVYKPYSIPEIEQNNQTYQEIDSYMSNFKGGNRIQRGGGWTLKGGGSNTSSFLANVQTVNSGIAPDTNNAYSLGTALYKWSDVQTVKVNGATPLSGTKTYYVSDSSGGAVNRKLTFVNGILTAET